MKKKLITLLLMAVTGIMILSCSNSDTVKPQREVLYSDIAGIWYFKSVIKLDGTIEPYVNVCSTKKDYIEIFTYGKAVGYVYYPDCTGKSENGSCSQLLLYDINKINACSSTFDGTITTLTKTEMRIDYNGEQHPGYQQNNFDFAKGVIFTRQ